MTSILHIIDQAKVQPKHLVLAEGLDERVAAGAVMAASQEIAKITLLGPVDSVRQLTRQAGDENDLISVIDPNTSDLCDELSDMYYEIRQHKGIDREEAGTAAKLPLNFANLMVRSGHADGSVAGAVHTTADVVRSAIQIIGMREDTSLVSSFFIMHSENRPTVLYADCGLVVSPTSDELAEIARATAMNGELLLGVEPNLAMLSFATGSSAAHPDVDKVVAATDKLRSILPDLNVGGPVQFDAAIDPDISERKMPGSALAGQANVFIFPDLNSGNIAYKITERLGGATAVGPILQGLNKPANDLSRGCDAEAVTNMIAVTAVQARH